MQKLDQKINTSLSVALSVIGIAGFFTVFSIFNLFGKQIDYVKDFLPAMLGMLFIGLGLFSFGAIWSYRFGIKIFVFFMSLILFVWATGFLK